MKSRESMFLMWGFKRHRRKRFALNLRPGEIVKVRIEGEITATFDENGMLEGLPFIPEMRIYCGKKFKVLESVNKIVVEGIGTRNMKNTVILEGLRCNGEAHGGCPTTCTLFWKEAWLKRVLNDNNSQEIVNYRDAFMSNNSTDSKDKIFSCQSTYLIKATSVPIWDIKQHIWEISSRFRARGVAALAKRLELIYMLMSSLDFKVRQFSGARKRAMLSGSLIRTPTASLNLQLGELVEIRKAGEILATLDREGRNRGLAFTREMLKYCGRRYRVLKRIDKKIDELSGRMKPIANTVILEGATCDGKAHGGCQRACYCLWREVWLKRVA